MRREFSPFEVGERFRISPPGTPPRGDSRIELVMAAGAFGSGEHETTASCLELLATLPDLGGARVLDLGCGTGILAIAALKLGAQSALCVDIDPKATSTCGRNCELNGVSEGAELVCGTLDQVVADEFDLTLANMFADVLLVVAEALVTRTKPGGTLLLSGIPFEDDFEVRRRFEELGCTVLCRRMLDEFTTVLLRRD